MDTRCAARQYGADEMHCHACRLTWSNDDKRQPACGRTVRVVSAPGPLVPVMKPLEYASAMPFR